MNKKISLPIIVSTILLVVFILVPFLILSPGSDSTIIQAPAGSYAESFAKQNNITFVQIPDSENADVLIPGTDANAGDNNNNVLAKENDMFTYNYVGSAVEITGFKGEGTTMVIPKTIDNLPVVAISMDFISEGIKTVQIPSTVNSIEGTFKVNNYQASFYAAISVILFAYVFSIVATLIGSKKMDTDEGTFYGIPFVYSGIVTFILISLWSIVALFLNLAPLYQAIVSIIIFAVALIKLLFRSVAKDMIEETGAKVKAQTAYIKLLTVDANTLLNGVTDEAIKAECNKIYEAVRFSDPMSNPALAGVEGQISIKFEDFSSAVKGGNIDDVKSVAKELEVLIKDRNNKCKILK